MGVYPLQVNMTRGELTPYLHGRVDVDHYQAGLARALNVVPLRYGGFTRCPGTVYGGPAKNADKTARLIPFQFNRDQVYAIEAGETYFRFWVMGAVAAERIESGGSPVEVATPYQEADLHNLRVRQRGDVLYIACDGYQTRTLTRNSETSWTLALYTADDGPYLPINASTTTITPSGTGNPIPTMASNGSPSGTASDSGSSTNAYKVFDNDVTTELALANIAGWVAYDFQGAAVYAVDGYWIRTGINPNGAPTNWKFQGYNGSTWVTLDSQTGQTGWYSREARYFQFNNATYFEAYRLLWFALQDVTATAVSLSQVVPHQIASSTAISLTASATVGINDGIGFQSSDVGRSIRFLGSDGRWRWGRITGVTSTTIVTIQLYGDALPDTDPTTLWRLGAFSEITGWPRATAIYEDRLVLAGTDANPVGGSATVSADYDNFSTSVPLVDDDAVSFTLTGGELNEIQWLVEGRDILAGTAGSLRAIGRNNGNAAFSPTNVRQRKETSVSASPAEPVSIEDVIVFIDGEEARYYEALYTYESEGYVARELSKLNEHLLAGGVKEIQHQSSPHRLLWGRTAIGRLVVSVYDRDEKVFGSGDVYVGGEVESILTLPGNKRTDLFMLVKRTINGSTVRYLETLGEFYRANYTVQGVPIYVNCAAVYDGSATATVTGLSHLEGETVRLWADGLDLGTVTVASGSVTLPNGLTAEKIVIGLPMEWRAEGLRLTQIGNRDGSGLGRRVNIAGASIDLYEARGVEAGSVSGTYEVRFEADVELDPFEAQPLKTGMYSIPVEDSWRNNGQWVLTGSRTYPVTVRGVQLEIEGEP